MPKAFVAHVYEDDYRQIQMLVQQYPNIETGGDLFGLWEDESTVVIQQFIGPGKKCRRTPTSFHQDTEYLQKVGSLITTEEGLCNVGEWHSHHQIGMPEPSAADRRTVFSNMPHLGLERFVLFIATIEGKGSSGKKRSHDDVKRDDIKLRPFLFVGSKQDIVKGKIEIISGDNPHRLDSRAKKEIEDGAEEVDYNGKRTATSSEENYGKTSQKPGKKKNGKMGPDNTVQSQQRTRQGYDTEKNRDGRGIQGERKDGYSNENQPPNAGSAAPSPTSQKNTLQSDTAPSYGPGAQGTSLWQVWDASHSGTAQGYGRGIQKNTQSTGGAYSSPQSPDHPSHTQQTSQRSRGRGHGAEHTNQAQLPKGRGGKVSISGINGKGLF